MIISALVEITKISINALRLIHTTEMITGQIANMSRYTF